MFLLFANVFIRIKSFSFCLICHLGQGTNVKCWLELLNDHEIVSCDFGARKSIVRDTKVIKCKLFYTKCPSLDCDCPAGCSATADLLMVGMCCVLVLQSFSRDYSLCLVK